MSKYAIRFWPFTTLDYKLAETYLEEKAKKGLLLVGLDVNSFPIVIYRKAQPANVKYCVDGFKHTDYIKKEEEEYNTYLDMAKKSGWIHVCEINYMQYFVSAPNANPVPLQTSPETEFEAMKKPYKKFELPLTLIWLFALIFMNNITGGEIVEKAMQMNSVLSVMVVGSVVLSIGFVRYTLFILRGSKAIVQRQELLQTKNNIAKVWGYFYNAIGLFMFGIITVMCPYFIIFRDYQNTGNKIALYCGAGLFLGICLIKISNTAMSIATPKKGFWHKIGLLGCSIMAVAFISACIFVL